MSLVNDALPADCFPQEPNLPNRATRYRLNYPATVNVVEQLLDRHLREGRAGSPAIRYNGRTWTYGLLAERVCRLANALVASGVKPGHRLVIHLPNLPEFIESWLAALRVGAVIVATIPMLKRREIEYIVAQTDPMGVITAAEFLPVFERCASAPPLKIVVGERSSLAVSYEELLGAGVNLSWIAPTSPEDVAIIAYTSGTTGSPKGTLHTHTDLLAIADTYAREVLSPRPEDRFCGHAPMGFTFALGGLLVFPLRFGASVVLDPLPFDPDRLLETIRREKITRLFTSPTACRLMLESKKCQDASIWRSVRSVVSAGQHLPRPTFQQWHETTGLDILNGCGSTEMLHIWMSVRIDEAIGGCTGRPVNLYEARLLDDRHREIRDREAEGIVSLRGPTGCRYWRNQNLQAQTVCDGWTLPGDRFRRDGEGRYWYLGRTDELIVRAGFKISPTEVEEVLQEHAAILEACVVGVPDTVRGQLAEGYIVLKPSWKPSDPLTKEILGHLKREIAGFKCPSRLTFVEKLPRTSSGKIDRRAVCQLKADSTTESPGPKANQIMRKGPVQG